MGEQLRQLFETLQAHLNDEEYEKALDLVDRILVLSPDDIDALNTRLFSLIELGKYDVALKHATDPSFERAYCLYRLHRLHDALSVVNALEDSVGVQQLRAQILYRLEDFDSCLDIYSSINEENDTELAVNICAAQAMQASSGQKPEEKGSWELCFNAACYFLGQGEFAKALNLLKDAENLVDTKESDDDLATIWAQRAFILQSQNMTEEASDLYSKVLALKPKDIALVSVVNNNIVAIRGDHDLFDSIKKLKSADTATVRPKLTRKQQRLIGANHALLHVKMNKIDEARRLIEGLATQFGDSDETLLMQAAVAHHEKQFEKVDQLLNRGADRSLLALAQVKVGRGEYEEAAKILERVKSIANLPAVVATLVSLHVMAENPDEALSTLKAAASYWHEYDEDEEIGLQNYLIFQRKLGEFFMSNEQFSEAAEAFKAAYMLERGDMPTLAQIIACYSHCNVEEAEKYCDFLPTSPVTSQKEEIDQLESTPVKNKDKVMRKDTNVMDVVAPKQGKKKKNKKPLLPKDFDPRVQPDPERWLPLTERSYYKKRHARKYNSRAQGAAAPVGEGARDRDMRRQAGGKASSTSSAGAAAIATRKGRKKGKKR